MPITRRRRAINPPDQAEQTNLTAERTEQVAEVAPAESVPETPQSTEPQTPVTPNRSEHPSAPAYPASFVTAQPPTTPVLNNEREQGELSPTPSSTPMRPERRPERHERHDFASGTGIEGGRRTARGELFRRPPQVPTPTHPVAPIANPAPLQPPSHEISLPLGDLLHLAYNPGYTGSEEARSALLQKLETESKAGGRARCWSCGALAIVYDRWNTRSKNFGEVGVAFCEICGVWSVM
jgi:hypothetical protein